MRKICKFKLTKLSKKKGSEEDDAGLMKREAGEKFLKAIQDNDAEAVVNAMSDLATMMD